MRCTFVRCKVILHCVDFRFECSGPTHMFNTAQLDGDKLPALEDKVMKQVLLARAITYIQAVSD
jgi:hypothetical protein